MTINKTIKIAVLSSIIVFTTGCIELQQVATSALNDYAAGTKPLTQTDISAGLKEALVIGAKKSVGKLSSPNGYLQDAATKILLPEEARIITDNISKLPGGQDLVDKVIANINNAASDAAKKATPIITNSIKKMSIQDALSILQGGDKSATAYLKKANYDELARLYKPIIDASLQKKLVGNISAANSWNQLTGNWNSVANSVVGQVTNLTPVNTDLSSYLTAKALDGLFLKIGETEADIRSNPAARVTDLLKRVFK